MPCELIATLPFALSRLLSRAGCHIGLLAIRFCCCNLSVGLEAREKKHAVTVNTVSFDKFLLARSRLVRLLTWAMLKTPQDIMV